MSGADFTVDTADWDRFAARVAGFPTTLAANVRSAFRSSGYGIAVDMIAGGAAAMPHGGGLSVRVAASSGDVGVDGPMRVSIRLRQPDGYNLAGMDAGHIRHPVFGDGEVRVSQHVPSGAFTGAFDRASFRAREAVAAAVRAAIATLGR